MDCQEFRDWLENRDTSDMSESDQARKHAQHCGVCSDLISKDDLLDRAIAEALGREPLPEQLERIVSLNLSSGARRRAGSSRLLIKAGSLLAGVSVLLVIFFALPLFNSSKVQFASAIAANHLYHHDKDLYESITDLDSWLTARNIKDTGLPPRFRTDSVHLMGGRICVIDGCRTVHLIFSENGKIVSFYLMHIQDVPAEFESDRSYSFDELGESIIIWRVNDQLNATVG